MKGVEVFKIVTTYVSDKPRDVADLPHWSTFDNARNAFKGALIGVGPDIYSVTLIQTHLSLEKVLFMWSSEAAVWKDRKEIE